MQTETKAIEEHIRALFSDPDIFSFGLNGPTLLLLDFSLRLKKELLRFICFILLLLDIPNRVLVVQYGLKVFVTQFGFEL